MQKEPLLSRPLWFIAYAIGTDLPMLLLKMIEDDVQIPIHRKYAQDWMEYSPYFRVFDHTKD